MNAEEIKNLLEAGIPGAEVQVQGDGSKYQVIVVSERFAKQQLVYGPLNEHIASGAIHAVSMQTLTPEEWRKMKLFG